MYNFEKGFSKICVFCIRSEAPGQNHRADRSNGSPNLLIFTGLVFGILLNTQLYKQKFRGPHLQI